MPTKLQIIQCVLTAILIYDRIEAAKIKTRYGVLLERTIKLQNELTRVEFLTDYFARILDANGYVLDEFDLIAIHNRM